MEEINKQWDELNKGYIELEKSHREYLEHLHKTTELQEKCDKAVKQQHYQLSKIKEKLKHVTNEKEFCPEQGDLIIEMSDRRTHLFDMQNSLPKRDNGSYLSVILGKVNVSLLSKTERFQYKDDYEKFKLTFTIVSFFVSLFAIMFETRFFDAVFHFLTVWYYSTLTIRENILRINGSKMKGWWVLHHHLSYVISGILITWPDGVCYRAFRQQLFYFALYIIAMQALQSFYQRSCLYRLRCLGLRDAMDITVALVNLLQSFYQRGSLYRLRSLGIRDSMDITVGMKAQQHCPTQSILPLLIIQCFALTATHVTFGGGSLVVTQLLRSVYQRGCLYRLRSLGIRDQMDITIEGFHSWMFRGLSFLLPFLFIGYFLQLYNAYVLFQLSRNQGCPEWQVLALAVLFLIVAVGNSFTTSGVVLNKYVSKDKETKRRRLKTKYSESSSAVAAKKDD